MQSKEKLIEAYPLQWPAGYPRTANPTKNWKFKSPAFGKCRDEVILELRRLGATNVIISSNAPLRSDGLPYADFQRRNIKDRGVAVYFKLDGQQKVLCCDKWDNWEDNLRAISLTIEAIRGMDRWGVSDMLNQVFTGFKALPENTATNAKPWWEVLGVKSNASAEEIKSAYRGLAKTHHPDVGGDPDRWHEISAAYSIAINLKQ